MPAAVSLCVKLGMPKASALGMPLATSSSVSRGVPKASALGMPTGATNSIMRGVPKASAEGIPAAWSSSASVGVPKASADAMPVGSTSLTTRGEPKASPEAMPVGDIVCDGRPSASSSVIPATWVLTPLVFDDVDSPFGRNWYILEKLPVAIEYCSPHPERGVDCAEPLTPKKAKQALSASTDEFGVIVKLVAAAVPEVPVFDWRIGDDELQPPSSHQEMWLFVACAWPAKLAVNTPAPDAVPVAMNAVIASWVPPEAPHCTVAICETERSDGDAVIVGVFVVVPEVASFMTMMSWLVLAVGVCEPVENEVLVLEPFGACSTSFTVDWWNLIVPENSIHPVTLVVFDSFAGPSAMSVCVEVLKSP